MNTDDPTPVAPTSFKYKKYASILKNFEDAPPPPKKPPVLLPITQEEWDKMEGKARWDSTVALRGPDLVHSDTLKWFTTSVIRFRLSKIMRVGGMVNNSLGFVVLPSDHYSIKTEHFDATHFLNHVREAACWLGVPVLYCSQDIFAKMLAGVGQNKVLKDLYEEVPTGPLKSRIGQLLGKEEPSCQE